MRLSPRRWIAVGIVSVAALVATGVTAAMAWTGDAGKVDGVPVTDQALAFYEERVLRTVQNAGGDEQQLRAAAIDELREDYALLALAADHRLSDARDVDTILAERESVNGRRAESAERGEVVYGRVEYAPQEFVSSYLTELRTRVVEALSSGEEPELVVSDDDVNAAFEAAPEEWSAAATTYRLTVVSLPTPVAPAPLDELAALPGAEVRHEQYTAREWEAMPYGPDAQRDVLAAEPGNIVGVYPARGGWVALGVDEVSVDSAEARAAYGSRIRSTLLEAELDELLRARIEAQRVELR